MPTKRKRAPRRPSSTPSPTAARPASAAPAILSYAPGVDPYHPRGPAPHGPGAPGDLLAALHRCTCPGCSVAHPPRDCAGCGAPMVIALDAGAHALTLCRTCARDLLAARAECRREMAAETRERMRAAALARSARRRAVAQQQQQQTEGGAA